MISRMGLLVLALQLGLVVGSGAAPPPARTAPGRDLRGKLTPCSVQGVEGEALCGRYEVYENRAARTGRKIGLKIVVLPARTPDVAPDPMVFFAGGAALPATDFAGGFSRAYADLRLHRDILLIDQRGTGGSNALDCELSTDPANADYRDDARFLA